MNKIQAYTDQLIKDMREAIINREDIDLSLIGSLDLLDTALVGTGLYFGDDWGTNGWELDFWGTIRSEEDDSEVADVSGSLYYGDLRVEFKHEN